ncbi:sigma-70 family RNA polymerase sigma factor [Actinoplanes sp. NPDC049596]|uniref:sigma-70 family RNA polymerase sigma factor n=1 Tax=unclassified Actinoplanes TaxID=2626549 RepID=UPI00342F5F3C
MTSQMTAAFGIPATGGAPLDHDERRRVAERMRALHAEHSRPLLRYLRAYTRTQKATAEDLLQETLLRAWRNVDSIPEQTENARRWLYTLARRAAIDFLRMRNSRPVEINFADMAVTPTLGDTTEMAIATESLKEAFRSLSDVHRTALSEMYLHGRNAEEIAGILGVPVGTVKSRVHYALQTVKAALATD